MITADDLNDQQMYLQEKIRLTNRVLIGVRIVEGYGLSLVGNQLNVSAGVAFDCAGRELILSEGFTIDVSGAKDGEYVCLKYREEEVKMKYDLEKMEDFESGFNTRIEEKVEVIIGPSDFYRTHEKSKYGFEACRADHAIPIAQLEQGRIISLLK